MGSRALIVVDLQRDFCPGGALPVAEGDRIVPVINALIARFVAAGAPVVASRDWHPIDHCSFVDQGGPWPEHCVAGTTGAEFQPELTLPADAIVVDKAERADTEMYSAFRACGLVERLRQRGIDEVVVCGLATDYCVKETALDARREGFAVVVVEDAVRGVDAEPGDSRRALETMVGSGARIARSADIAP